MIDTRGLTGKEIYEKYFDEGKWRNSEDTRVADKWVEAEFDKLPSNLQNMDSIYDLYRKYFDTKEAEWYASSDEEAAEMLKEAEKKAAEYDAETAKKSEIAGYTLDDLKQLGGKYSSIFQGMSADDYNSYYDGYIKKNTKSINTNTDLPELELTDAGRQAIWDYLHKEEEEAKAAEDAKKAEEEAAKEEVITGTKADVTENEEPEDTSVNTNNDVTNESAREPEISSNETADFTGRETQQATQQAMADSADATQTEAYQNYLANATAGINKSRAGMLASQGADPTQNVQSNYNSNRQLGTSTQNDYLKKMTQANELQNQADMLRKGQGWNIASGALQGAGTGASIGLSMF